MKKRLDKIDIVYNVKELNSIDPAKVSIAQKFEVNKQIRETGCNCECHSPDRSLLVRHLYPCCSMVHIKLFDR